MIETDMKVTDNDQTLKGVHDASKVNKTISLTCSNIISNNKK